MKKNIEKKGSMLSSKKQYGIQDLRASLFDKSKGSTLDKINSFTKYAGRQNIAKLVAQYEMLMMTKNVLGNIIEGGIFHGSGLLGWANLAVSLEPYNYQCKIVGFDTFTGLPESWRSYPRGYFSNNGNVPNINDERVIWHKGLVEDTITELPSELILNNSLLIIFDLDLFKPTMHCINYLRKYLKSGDLIYFDEPHDEHESTIINYLLLEDNSRFKTVLCTPCHLLMVYE